MAATLPRNQEDCERYLREIKAGKVADILRDGGIVEIEPDSTWMPDDLYVAISYARAEGATVKIVMEPPRSRCRFRLTPVPDGSSS